MNKYNIYVKNLLTIPPRIITITITNRYPTYTFPNLSKLNTKKKNKQERYSSWTQSSLSLSLIFFVLFGFHSLLY